MKDLNGQCRIGGQGGCVLSRSLYLFIYGPVSRVTPLYKAFRHVDTLYKNLFTIYIVKEIYE